MKKIFALIILFTGITMAQQVDTTALKSQQQDLFKSYNSYNQQLTEIKAKEFDLRKQEDYLLNRMNELISANNDIERILQEKRKKK